MSWYYIVLPSLITSGEIETLEGFVTGPIESGIWKRNLSPDFARYELYHPFNLFCENLKLHNSSSRGMSQSRKLMLDGGSEGERVVGDYIFLSWPGPGPVLGLF